MMHIDFWLSPLQEHIKAQSVAEPRLGEVRSIRFLSSETELQPQTVYLGEAETVSSFINNAPLAAKGHTFFCASPVSEVEATDGVNLIVTDLDLFRLYDALADVMLACRSRQETLEKKGHDTERVVDFHTLLDEMIVGKQQKREETVRLFQSLEYPLHRFGRIILVDFEGGEETAAALLETLSAMFPQTNLCLYRGQIVLLVSREDRFPQDSKWIDAASMQALLAQHRAFAMIGTPSSHYEQLRTAYILAQRTLAIVKRLWRTDTPRYFYFDDTAEYLTIDLCCRAYTKLVGHEDLIYLTQPELIKVYRHDQESSDNLLDVLYYYCLNNCSISKTAQAVYMHRNTVAAKLERLKKIVDVDISDGNMQQRIVFSYRVLRYAEKFSKDKPATLLSRRFAF